MKYLRDHWLILVLALFVAVMLLTSTLRAFVREIVVIPLLYVLWVARFLFEAVPQAWVWSCFLGVASLIMIASLITRRKKRRRARAPQAAPEGRVRALAQLIEQAKQDPYFKWRLAQELQKITFDALASQALAEQRGRPSREIKQKFKQGKIELPPDVRAYLQASLKPISALSPTRHSFAGQPASTPLDLEPARLIQFLETYLDIDPTQKGNL